jgi:prolyl oligopeptidase|eukprot:COSAG01_NODE_11744_length_1868_cov_2.430752_2_plen_231_part_00
MRTARRSGWHMSQLSRRASGGKSKHAAAASAGIDENQWLEEVLGQSPLDWAAAQSERCVKALGDPAKTEMHTSILRALDSPEKIAALTKIDGYYYNFWQDASNPRGIWRRRPVPPPGQADDSDGSGDGWEVVLDVDALGKAECQSWVWGGVASMADEGPDVAYDLVLLKLSPGGSDAAVVREFQLSSKTFVPAEALGFEVPEAKSTVSYKGRNTLLVASDFGEGSLTSSG